MEKQRAEFSSDILGAMRKARRGCLAVVVLAVLGPLAGWLYLNHFTRPMANGASILVRYGRAKPLNAALDDLQQRGIIRSSRSLAILAWLGRRARLVSEGTYRFNAGMTANQVLDAIQRPLRQAVRIPEGWWIARVARKLEEKNVCSAAEYIRLAHQAEHFNPGRNLPPPQGSLEGYLFPDTYDLPPLIGAEATIRKQLEAFVSKIDLALGEKKIRRAVVIASMVELETAADRERPIIAGVIENRLRAKMPLQIDATVLYAMQEWKQLSPGTVRTVKSPYNTYLVNGLPPGPIGSPGRKSIEAALHPARHPYLYYVALPDRTHLFARTYAEHLANIRRRRAALR